jgi:hypothetical protein
MCYLIGTAQTSSDHLPLLSGYRIEDYRVFSLGIPSLIPSHTFCTRAFNLHPSAHPVHCFVCLFIVLRIIRYIALNEEAQRSALLATQFFQHP